MLVAKKLNEKEFLDSLDVLNAEDKTKVLQQIDKCGFHNDTILKYSSQEATPDIDDFNALNDIITTVWKPENKVVENPTVNGGDGNYVYVGKGHVVVSTKHEDALYVHDFINKK